MKIAALAPWYGSKRTLAPRIVEGIGKHHAYWEPFCGSMAVLLVKPACSMETVNDLNGDLVNLARVIRDPMKGAALYRRLRRVLASQTLLEEARAYLNGPGEQGDIERAEAYFVNCWLSMNGSAGTHGGIDSRRGISRRFSSGGGAPAVRFAGAVSSIPEWRDRLRRVMVLNDDGLMLCERIEDVDGCVIYADPPYLEKGDEYIHDFESEDHARLADALRRFKRTRVLVSYYDHPRLAELYPGWQRLELDMTKTMGNQGRRDQTGVIVKAPELLLLNWEYNDQPKLFA